MSCHNCEALTRNGFSCINRSRYTTMDDKHYCKIHWKQLMGTRPPPDEDTVDCSICYETTNNKGSIRTICNHVFCKKCFQKWTQTHDSCPLCRTHVKQIPSYPIETFLMNETDMFTFMNELINEQRLYIDNNVLTVANAYAHENQSVYQLNMYFDMVS
jgi:hypothetical protein